MRSTIEPRQDLIALKASERLFRDLLDSAPDAIVVCNENGDIMLVNQQAENLFGYEREELLGETIEILLPGRFRTEHVRHRGHFIARAQARPMGMGLELYGLHKSGTEIPIEISLSPVETDRKSVVE